MGLDAALQALHCSALQGFCSAICGHIDHRQPVNGALQVALQPRCKMQRRAAEPESPSLQPTPYGGYLSNPARGRTRREIDSAGAPPPHPRQGVHVNDTEWFAEHAAYLATPEWAFRRGQVLNRDGYRCQARLPGCRGEAVQVHHLTYKHWRNEPLFDLTSVCVACHDEITAMDRESRPPTSRFTQSIPPDRFAPAGPIRLDVDDLNV